MHSLKIFQFLFFSFFLVTLLPYFGSLDVIAPQWLFLSFVNLFTFIFTFKLPHSFPKSNLFILYSFFIFQVLLSLFYSNNVNVSIVDSSRFLIVFFTIFNFYFLLKNKILSLFQISSIISFVLVIEVFYSLLPFFGFFYYNDFSLVTKFNTIYSENLFIGFAGNKNITAASIAVKLPFLLYCFYFSKKFIKYIISFFLFLFFLLIFFLRARSVFVSLALITFFYSIFLIYNRKISFILIPLIIVLSFFISSFLMTKNDTSPLLQDFESIEISASSSNDRFLLWDNAFSYILEHPFIGCGIGNWKIESLPYWKTHLSNYIVPYHAHNDFLELSTELGFIGGFTFFLVITFMLISVFTNLFKSKSNFDLSFMYFTVFASLVVYFVDLSLNFPSERPRMQIVFCLLFSLIILFKEKSIIPK